MSSTNTNTSINSSFENAILYLYNYSDKSLVGKFSYQELVEYFKNIASRMPLNKSVKTSFTETVVTQAVNCKAGYGRFLTNYYIANKPVIKFSSIEDEMNRFNEWLKYNMDANILKLKKILSKSNRIKDFDIDRVYEVFSFMIRQIQRGSVINNYESTFISKYRLQTSYDNDPNRNPSRRASIARTESAVREAYKLEDNQSIENLQYHYNTKITNSELYELELESIKYENELRQLSIDPNSIDSNTIESERTICKSHSSSEIDLNTAISNLNSLSERYNKLNKSRSKSKSEADNSIQISDLEFLLNSSEIDEKQCNIIKELIKQINTK